MRLISEKPQLYTEL